MKFVLLDSRGSAPLLARGWRLPRDQVRVLADAQALLEVSEERLVGASLYVEAQGERAYAEGFEKGREEGRAVAQIEGAKALAEALAAFGHLQHALEERIGELALFALRRMVGQAGPEELLGQVVRQALAELAEANPIRLRVHPRCMDVALQALCACGVNLPVQADQGLSPDDCIFDCAGGAIHAGLEVQLSALQVALQGRSFGLSAA